MRASSSLLQQQRVMRRYNSTEAAAASPKIAGIVDQISQLTLLETADLVANLKVRKTRGAIWTRSTHYPKLSTSSAIN
jgi:large subunit ribosomal protein L7/L12